jgi:hypothetical protein
VCSRLHTRDESRQPRESEGNANSPLVDHALAISSGVFTLVGVVSLVAAMVALELLCGERRP